MSILLGLEAAIKSMRASTTAVNTASHNIANMNTEGYSKQTATISATQPINNYNGAGQLGTGSAVSYIQRVRNIYLDTQIRTELGGLGESEILADTYKTLAAMFPEVSGVSNSGISAQLEAFWKGWEDLAAEFTKPIADRDIESIKNQIYSAANGLAGLVRERSSALMSLQMDLNAALRLNVQEANDYIKQIASFNQAIVKAKTAGQVPNDILDKRELAIQNLSKIMNVYVAERADGASVITIGGRILVNGAEYNKLATMAGTKDAKLEDVGIMDAGAAPVSITKNIDSGRLAGIIESRDVVIQGYITDLDILASSMITVVNKFHKTGVTDVAGVLTQNDREFFTGTRAADFRVSEQLQGGTMINDTKYQEGDLAEIMANLDNKLMSNWVTSNKLAGVTSDTTLGSTGKLIINSIEIDFAATDTVRDLIQKININVEDFMAVFDDSNNSLFMSGSQYFNIEETDSAGNAVIPPVLLNKIKMFQEQVSAAPVNYYASSTGNKVVGASTWATQQNKFAVDPTASGTVTVNFEGKNYYIDWTETQIINLTAMNIGFIDASAAKPNFVLATFKNDEQKIYFSSGINSGADGNRVPPFMIYDQKGNFTKSMNLVGAVRFQDHFESTMGKLKGALLSAKNMESQYDTTVESLKGMQEEVTAVDENAEIATAKLYQRQYDASVRLMAVIDQMLNMLINRMGSPSSNIE
ncbi:MAG TPA: flagellar hook-associated protein FlgK [Candidatus Goldiibacteriota bacterium]|nr:flagellar hook-associated protein FlgK [Candidatus Goldiibacteriota bacterium]HRQ44218.1 flagellar hook-associated protein FlgK [Candidatus Goldiibacteriota bacterium]